MCLFSTGMYTVKGQTYLQGKVHEEKIRSGMVCEVFVEVYCTCNDSTTNLLAIFCHGYFSRLFARVNASFSLPLILFLPFPVDFTLLGAGRVVCRQHHRPPRHTDPAHRAVPGDLRRDLHHHQPGRCRGDCGKGPGHQERPHQAAGRGRRLSTGV